MGRLSGHRNSTSGRAVAGGVWSWWLVCVLAGALQAASLAWPLNAWAPPGLASGQASGALQIASLALLALAVRHAARPRQAAWRGWWFALAWLAGTFWWLYVSMHVYGGLAAPLAVLAVLLLAGFLALYYALAAGLMRWLAPRSVPGQMGLFAALWTLAELMRGRWLTGFPWGAGGYAQVDLMASLAPWLGVYGMGAAAALVAWGLAALPALWQGRYPGKAVPSRAWRRWLGWGLLMAAVPLATRLPPAGQAYTRPAGTLDVWLLQGNVPQDEKFVPGKGVALALSWYPAQLQAALRAGERAPDLVVAPETALPLLPEQLGAGFWEPLLDAIDGQGHGRTAVLIGLPLGDPRSGYTNSAWGIRPEDARGRGGAFPAGRFYRYDKHHLVPFGEFIPPLFRWFVELMQMPLGEFARGALPQAPWVLDGQRLAPNICYEDLFGEELAASFADAERAPTMLVNLSNIAWFGDTVAIDQHLHVSRVRAMELGRPMLRATNTGATALIDHRGQVVAALPRLQRGHLAVRAEGREGLTPYARWAARAGLWPLWGLCVAALLVAWAARRLRTGP
jgi:apolipoprotein N-acyltransferase